MSLKHLFTSTIIYKKREGFYKLLIISCLYFFLCNFFLSFV